MRRRASVEAPASIARLVAGCRAQGTPSATAVGLALKFPRMSGRDERVARNEATAREINEGIEEAHEGTSSEHHVRMVCECGQEACDRLIAITIPEYERVLEDPRTFAVVRDHVMADVERVVYETDRFVVVGKREGTPAQLAVSEDPRT